MIIAATADVHSPNLFRPFVEAMEQLQVKPDLFLMAGDMAERGLPAWYEKVYNVLFGKITCPIVACFGNTEWIPDKREEIRRLCPEIKFVDDDSTIVTVGRTSVGIIGTIGSLDLPTRWQQRNIPNIMQIYQSRVDLVNRHLTRLVVEMRIVLMHYAPSYTMLEGENPRFWANMGSRQYEPVIMECKPDLVVHGHSHRGRRMAWLDTTPVFNVSFALNREIVIIDTEKLKPGITKFVE
jgi:Icc-related predicted phosphoesterase